MAPVSRYVKPSRSATARATVDFPAPAGPSMAMTMASEGRWALAPRRAAETGGDPERVLREQAERDERDASAARTVLEPAADAVPVDTTGLTLDEVVAQIELLATEAQELR